MKDAPRRLHLVWHYWNSTFAAVVSIIGIACSVFSKNVIQNDASCPAYYAMQPFLLTVWALNISNHLFLLTYDLICTHTWPGTFVAQQLISLSIIGMLISILGVLAADKTHGSYISFIFSIRPTLSSILKGISIISAILTVFLSTAPLAYLSYLFVRAKRSGDPKIGWLVNTKDLVADRIPDGDPTIAGSKRNDDCSGWVASSIRSSAISVGNLFWNAFFRRVDGVETMTYAFILNSFALLSISALCVRASISLSLAEDRDCRLRTRVDECFNQEILCQNARFATMYGQSPPNSDAFSVDIKAVRFNINGTLQQELPCNPSFSGPFKLFDCSAMCQLNAPDDGVVAFNITMQSLNASALSITPLLKVWFADTDPAIQDISDISGRFSTPNLVASWQLHPGYQWRAEIGLRKRKFITSSFIRDVVAGNNPNYLTINLRPITTIASLGRIDTTTANGIIFPATQGSSAMYDTDLNLPDARTYVGCEVIEEYRDSSAFDILGSIGGLLALVQGLYIWIAGRPLLWGLTGSKIVAPFGLMGNFSRSSFRKKLRTHYRVPGPEIQQQVNQVNQAGQPLNINDLVDTIRIAAFLRDYVIEMGPADIPEDFSKDLESQTAQASPPTTQGQAP